VKDDFDGWLNATTGNGLAQQISWKPTAPVYVGQLPGIVITLEVFFYTRADDPYHQ